MPDKTYNITELIEYMKICVMNTRGKEQLKCLRILEILEKKEKSENDDKRITGDFRQAQEMAK